jgi:predicted acylesterase/phospholipase RssA
MPHASPSLFSSNHNPFWGRLSGALALLVAALLLSGCAGVLTRSPVPEEALETALPYGITGMLVREWGDNLEEDKSKALLTGWVRLLREARADDIAAGGPIKEVSLAISGGGPDGAFGAGLLNGWTARGDRPRFTVVTGISTGAIVALFAFLGPEYDETLKEIYTTYNTDQLASPTYFAALTGGWSLADTSGYQRLIEHYVSDAVVKKLAEEFNKGRVLLIGTTNLDASRPVVWNVAGIAATGHPSARRLIQDIIQASSAIPAAFPPVLIPVETPDGKTYDEMHVDGGATQQVMFFNPMFPLKQVDQALGVRFDRTLYVIINNKLKKGYHPVKPRLLPIASVAASSLIGGSGTGDIYRIFAIAQRDQVALRIMEIPRDFEQEPGEPFDPVYMQALFDLGYETGVRGTGWQETPPGFRMLKENPELTIEPAAPPLTN